jgi:hypothetical protein
MDCKVCEGFKDRKDPWVRRVWRDRKGLGDRQGGRVRRLRLQVPQGGQGARVPRDPQEQPLRLRVPRDGRAYRAFKDRWDLQVHKETRAPKEVKVHKAPRDLQDPKGLRVPKVPKAQKGL